MTPPITVLTGNHATADKRSHAHLTEAAFSHQLSIKPPSRVTTTTLLKHTSDSQKTTSRHVTETTLHHSATLNTGTLPNLANISGFLKTTRLTTLFHGASFHLAHLTTAQANDVTQVCLKEKFLIICRPDLSSLNKRNEFVSSCRHRNKSKTKRCCETAKHLIF